MIKKRYVLLLLSGLAAFASCYNEKEQLLAPNSDKFNCTVISAPSYATDLYGKVVQSTCAVSGCHDSGTKSGGYDFTTYSGLKAAASGGRLMGALNRNSGFSPMPKNGDKLSACRIQNFQNWVNNGAPNN